MLDDLPRSSHPSDIAAWHAHRRRNVGRDFLAAARGLAIGAGSPQAAAAHAGRAGSPRAQAALKAAVPAAGLANSAALRQLAVDYIPTLAPRSVFARLLGDNLMIRVPLDSLPVTATAIATAATTPEGRGKPVKAMSFAAPTIPPQKVACITVSTEELWRSLAPGGPAFLTATLEAGIAVGLDTLLFAAVLGGPPTFAWNPAAPLAVLQQALASIASPTGLTRPVAACDQPTAMILATTTDTAGARLFPNVDLIAGGSLLPGLPLSLSAATDPGVLVLIDGSAVAGDVAPTELDEATQASLMLDDDPGIDSLTPTAASLTSLFQSNSRALRLEAYAGAVPLRAGAAATITGIGATT
ncbi:hypothetical protein FFK22_014455 [Mycobacterium sp. KBS0706]|uniref:hypothetical protein n=1 Tax=Mycobacterium sp. KBS0706 TaxID=2578109 RepID=UPI00110F840C|nr:hypothetical protein [Mycobacterium sp. KBS0706]TSD88035.1 hypothetical protein FFK22_014455 [Mycobacterium sp. KBS0706]